MTDPRVQRARDALEDAYHNLHESDIVRDLLAVVDELQQWKSEAADVMIGLQDLGKALDVPFGKRITGEAGVEAATHLRDRAMAAEAERDRLQATVERVEALADHWRNVEMPEAPVADEVLTAVLNGEG